VPPPESSRISKSDVEIPEFDLQSLLVPQEAIDKYKMCHARLKKELKLISVVALLRSNPPAPMEEGG
jgi:hypothetical protein